ncbi:hypothetical protein ACFWZU_02945 [Frateuria sp. GZRR33]|uniref:hypothetical protein n=1 Tax=Frateuria sp. GZRR33 TaxID=3351535 RepID=UPI003EDC9600
MPLQLLFSEDIEVGIPLDPSIQEAWQIQYERSLEAGRAEGFQKRLATSFAQALTDCLDADLKPPTDAQLRYATSIARELGVALPPEALRFRGAMADFIGRFAERLREKRGH